MTKTVHPGLLSVLGTLALALVLSFDYAQGAQETLKSPDGRLAILVSDSGGLHYRVEVDGKPVVVDSPLGLEFQDGTKLGAAATIAGIAMAHHDGVWENRFGKRRMVPDRWQQAILALRENGPKPRTFGLIVRAYDDGVAFRYDLPEASGLGSFVLTKECTQFRFAGDYRCWFGGESACAENQYPEAKLSAIPALSREKSRPRQPFLSVLPLLVEARGCYVAVAESDLLDWAGMFLTGTGSPSVAVSLAARNDGHGLVSSTAPRVGPWRVLMIGRTAGDLVNSDLIATLATPNRLGDVSWVKPGVSAWDPWWTGVNPHLPQRPEFMGVFSRGDTRSHKEYIDFAAEMGWSYQLVDWFWYENMSSYDIALNLGRKNPARPPVDFEKCVPHVDMPALLAHANRRGVRLMIWLHSYDLDRYGIDRACALFSRWGAAGLKIDFMNSDSQETVAWYAKVIATAARYRLLIDFHGAYKPTGLARTYPNYITQEGVLGNEYNKLDGNLCTPLHTITLPFTRALLGPMDFTPGGFLNRAPKDFKITAPAVVVGTRARQLAMTVIYPSPLLVLCDSPANYRGQPGVEFFRGLPTVWDETVVLAAEVGRTVAIARRSHGRWYLAAMNGDAAVALRVPLAFLGPGKWSLKSFADKPDAAPASIVESVEAVDAATCLPLSLAPAGGFAGVLTEK